MTSQKPIWGKLTDGGYWSTASLYRDEKGYVLLAQEYRSKVAVTLSEKDIKRLLAVLQGLSDD